VNDAVECGNCEKMTYRVIAGTGQPPYWVCDRCDATEKWPKSPPTIRESSMERHPSARSKNKDHPH